MVLCAMLVLVMLGFVIFFTVTLMIELVRSDKITDELAKIMGDSSSRVDGAISVLAFAIFLGYLIDSLFFCRLEKNKKDIFCAMHPRLGHVGTQRVKLLFLLCSMLGVGWFLYLHERPRDIQRWQIILLVLMMMPAIVVLSAVFLFILSQTRDYYYYY